MCPSTDGSLPHWEPARSGLVFAKLGELKPVLGGPYVYAKDALGPYIGFQTNAVYWLANWMGNVAIAVSTTGYLAAFIPWMGHRPGSTVGTIAVIWLLTVVNMIGPKFVGRFETWTISLALIPILGIATVGWFWFEPSLFKEAWNVTGKSDFHAASRAASIALWAFMGIESAAVSATNIENPRRNVPIATLAGLALSAVVYVSCSTVIMGLIPNAELQKSHAPFAEAGARIFGRDRSARGGHLRGRQDGRCPGWLDAGGGRVEPGCGAGRDVSQNLRPRGSARRAGAGPDSGERPHDRGGAAHPAAQPVEPVRRHREPGGDPGRAALPLFRGGASGRSAINRKCRRRRCGPPS